MQSLGPGDILKRLRSKETRQQVLAEPRFECHVTAHVVVMGLLRLFQNLGSESYLGPREGSGRSQG